MGEIEGSVGLMRGAWGFACACALAASGTAYAYNYVIPCDSAGSTCPFGLRPCSEVKSELRVNLQRLLDEKVADYYKGQDRALVQLNPGSPIVADRTMDLPICNPAFGEETAPNPPHQPGNCGNFAYIARTEIIANGDTADPPDLPPIPGCGKREASYFRGAYIQALTCFTKELLAEINVGTISAANCEAPAAGAGMAANTLSSSINALSALCDLDEAKFADHCKVPTPATVPVPTASPSFYPVNAENIQHLESVCYLVAGRARAEASSVYVALCEAIARTKRHWPAGYEEIKRRIDVNVNQYCGNWSANGADQSFAPYPSPGCSNGWSVGPFDGDVTDPDCVVRKYWECYKANYYNEMIAALNDLYPNSVNATGDCYRGGAVGP